MLATLAAMAMYTSRAAAAFTDIGESAHRAGIEFCENLGFVKGTSATAFDPDGALTREQFATVWGRTFHLRPPHRFRDVAQVPAGETDNAIIVMHALGFFNGVSDTEFGRKLPVTREQTATVVARTYLPGVDGENKYEPWTDSASISEYARDAVSACMDMGLFDHVFTGDAFHPQSAITRGEVCHIIYNLMYDEVEQEPPATIAPPLESPPEEPTDGPVMRRDAGAARMVCKKR
jgi:hypothetical protein